MVHFFQCTNARMPLPLLLSMLLLLLSLQVAHSDASKLSFVQTPKAGRLSLRLQEVGTKEIRGNKMAGRALIGSRPPRCERVCMSCGHCEAIQVPIVPQERRGDQQHLMSTTSAVTYRYNGYSNYKPLSWKCKCGGIIVDP